MGVYIENNRILLIMEFSGEKVTFKRVFNYIFGLFLITLGVAFSIKSGLGSTPVASVPYSLNLILGIDLGITTLMFQIFLVCLELVLLRGDFKRKHFLQVFVSLIFGAFTSFSISLMAFVPPADNLMVAFLMSFISVFLINQQSLSENKNMLWRHCCFIFLNFELHISWKLRKRGNRNNNRRCIHRICS